METRTETSQRLQLDYAGVGLTVRSDDRAMLTWLAEFLAPSFTAVSHCASDYAIHCDTDNAEYERLLRLKQSANCRDVDCFSNDGNFSRSMAWTDSNGVTWLHPNSEGAFVGIPATGSKLWIIDRDAGCDRPTVMRVVRELATMAQLHRGRLLLHAAAFKWAGEATIVCGPKQAGKTTFLMHALAAGCGFIANDRVVVAPRSANRLAFGMPTIVSVRQPTLEFFPDLAERCAASRFDYRRSLTECGRGGLATPLRRKDGGSLPGLSGLQFCRLLGAPAVASAPLARVIFPNIQPHVHGSELIPLRRDDAARRLAQSVFAPSRPWRWSTAFERFAAAGPPSAEWIESECRRLTAGVACFECLLGRDAYQSRTLWTQSRRRVAA